MAAYTVHKSLLQAPEPAPGGLTQAAHRYTVMSPDGRIVSHYDDQLQNGKRVRYNRYHRSAKDAATARAQALSGRHTAIAEAQQKAQLEGEAIVKPRGQRPMRVYYRT